MADIHRPLSIAALVAIALGFLGMLWWTFLFFALGPEPLPVESVQTQPTQGLDVPIERVVAMHLFGQPTDEVAPKTEQLADTRLSLVLNGVFVADEADASTALIAQQSREPRLYRIADRLPGNARLEAVHRDRVVISRGGVRELLRFEQGRQMIRPGTGTPQANARRAKPSRTARGAASGAETKTRSRPRPDAGNLVERTLAKHRDEIERDPRKFVESLGLTASETGGYVLGTFADNDAGLQPGDRLLSVNGRPVGNPDEDRRQLERIVAGGSVDIQIQRGEQLIKFKLSLDSLN